MKTVKRKCDAFFRKMDRLGLALSYNDVLTIPCHSHILPKDTDLRTKFSRHVSLKIPLVSAAMDTVTEAPMAIVMAMLGGLGIIHKKLPAKEQASAVEQVKHKLNAFIPDPICICKNQTVEEVLDFAQRKGYNFHSFLVKDSSGNVIGLVTSRDFFFCTKKSKKIADIMTTNIISAEEGTDEKTAYKIMMAKKIKILPVFHRQGKLAGIFTLTDVKRIVVGSSPNYNLDKKGTLIVGAAIGPISDDAIERMELLAKAKVNVVVIDTSHGDSDNVIEMVKYCVSHYPNIDVVAGNVAVAGAVVRLARAGAAGFKVGIGPGSICTTRIITGAGVPQVTAVYDCCKAARSWGIPGCADGGVEQSGHIEIALAAGADTVMLGKLLAGTTESPGKKITLPNGELVVIYRGMGSLSAMMESEACRERYGQANVSVDELIAQGVEGVVSFQGDVSKVVHQLIGGPRDGMGLLGAESIKDLHKRADFNRITSAGLQESHPHGLASFKDAPNYKT